MLRLFSGITVLATALSLLPLLAAAEKKPASGGPPAWLDPDHTEPAGTHYRTFKSQLAGGQVSYLIYLPPDYETNLARRYPVVYFLHGYGGSPRAGVAFVKPLDEFIRAGKAPPMIAVLVNGLAASFYCDSPNGKQPVDSVITQELIPHVDQTYRTLARREDRAVEGFSMGGYGAAHLGFKHPDLFGLVSVRSGALTDSVEWGPLQPPQGGRRQMMLSAEKSYFEANDLATLIRRNAPAIRGQTRVRIAVGGADTLRPNNQALHEFLQQLQIEHEYEEVPDAPHNATVVYAALGEREFAWYRQAWTAGEARPAGVKWHPGHYAFVQFAALEENHLDPNFRGVQKCYAWRTLEPEKDRYDFEAIRSDLALLARHKQRLVIQVQTKTFAPGQNDCPRYLAGADYGGGVYRTRWGSFNPILWDERVNQRLNALYARLGAEFDREAWLEAVVIPESATTFDNSLAGELRYTPEKYVCSVEAGMQALKDAFPQTVVMQYVNMPAEALQPLADYARRHGIGFGGPDIYPHDPLLTDPQRGVYRFYPALSGLAPLGAAVQQNDYTQKAAFRGPPGETPVAEIYAFGREKLRLNYIFWGVRAGYFEKVQALLAEPSIAQDPAGGLNDQCPQALAAADQGRR